MIIQQDLFNQHETFWTNTVHRKENTPDNQRYLSKNRERYGGQNKRVFDFLMAGGMVNGDIVASWEPKIRHLPRRIKDLTDLNSGWKIGFKISGLERDAVTDLKNYYMTESDRAFNKILIEKLSLNRTING